MVKLSMASQIRRARWGEVANMPGVLRVLAERLRAGELDVAEVEFLAAALEQTAAAKDPAKEAARALCLTRARGRETRASKVDRAIDRAFRVRDLVRAGARATDAFEIVASEQGLAESSEVRKAYYKYKAVLWLGSPDGG